MAANVNKFIEPMVYEIVKMRPSDPVSHALKWLKSYIQKRESNAESSDSEEDGVDEIPFDQSKLEKKKLQGKTRSRMGISEEVFGNFNKKDSVILKTIPKTESSKLLILSLIRHSILFKNLDYKE